jgi:hypothetical protein
VTVKKVLKRKSGDKERGGGVQRSSLQRNSEFVHFIKSYYTEEINGHVACTADETHNNLSADTCQWEKIARMWSECSWLTILCSYSSRGSCSCLAGRKMQAASHAVQLALQCTKKFFLYEVREVLGWLVRTVTL